MKKFLAIACLTILSFSSAGCPKQQDLSKIPGKPVNTFEWDTYRTLLDTQAGINTAKQQYAAGTLPDSAKPALNRAIALQDTLVDLLKNYDKAARAGNDLTSLEAEITADLASLAGFIGELKQPATAKTGS